MLKRQLSIALASTKTARPPATFLDPGFMESPADDSFALTILLRGGKGIGRRF
jgi:hypothetical protein